MPEQGINLESVYELRGNSWVLTRVQGRQLEQQRPVEPQQHPRLPPRFAPSSRIGRMSIIKPGHLPASVNGDRTKARGQFLW